MSAHLSRRGVLAGAAAIAGMTALPQILNGPAVIGHVVVDARLPAAALFARGIAAARRHSVGALDDLCSRWYTTLRAAVQADAGPIAGLTTWMDYVIMRSCAAEIGYARAFLAEHVPQGEGRITHAVTAHPDLLSALTGHAAPRDWAQVLGQALASGAHLRSRFVAGQVFSATTAAAAGQMRGVTWVFSPA